MTDWLKDFEQRVEVAQRYDEKVHLEPDQARELIDAASAYEKVKATTPSGIPHDKHGDPLTHHTSIELLLDATKRYQETAQYWVNKHDHLLALLEQVELVVTTIEKAEYVNGDSMDHEGARSVASHLLAELQSKGRPR